MDAGGRRAAGAWLMGGAIFLWLLACLLPVAGCPHQSAHNGLTGAYAFITGWEVTSAWPAWVGQFIVLGLGLAAQRRSGTLPREARRTSAIALAVAVLAIANAALFLTSGVVDCDGNGHGTRLGMGFALWSLALLGAASTGLTAIRSEDPV